MPELRLYKSRGKASRLLLGCAAFVGIGAWLLSRPDVPKLVGWLSISFFGLGIPMAFFQLLDRRPQIIINEIGVFDRTTHQEFINWEIIQDVYVAEINHQRFICLVVDEAFEPSRQKGPLRLGLAQLNRELGFQELNINLSLVQVDAVRLAEFLLAMRAAEQLERTYLVKQAIEKL